MANWLNKWRIKANETDPVTLNNIEISKADNMRYLGFHLGKVLIWQKHI